MKKIAVIIDTWYPYFGGGQVSVWEIHKRIAEKGVKIDIVTRNLGQSGLKPTENIREIKLGKLAKPRSTFSEQPLSTIERIPFLIKALFFLNKNDYDLIVIHPYLPAVIGKAVMTFRKIPVIMTIHGSMATSTIKRFAVAKFIAKLLFTKLRYDAEISVSKDFLELPNVNKKVFYIPNGVNIKLFDSVAGNRSVDPSILFVGRLHHQKNIKRLISAFEIASKKFPKATLQIVGEGAEKESLVSLITNKSLKNKIFLKGQLTGNDLIKKYKSSSIFILPSLSEGQPLVLLEAWAAKLPVIVTSVGDNESLIKDGINGYLIKNPLNVQEIASVIEKALDNKNLSKMGQNGYNFVASQFSWDKSAQKTIKVYESLTKTRN